MSEAPSNLPTLSTEESTVVDRFVTASRDVVPTVQVSLAKRIILPGSNRVICMAARTSVPLNDDEVASVSDLALRLSDGTNVVLSLSFFNDAGVADYVPFHRPAFAPNFYVRQDDSRLGLVLLAMLLVSLAGYYSSVMKPFGTWAQLQPALSSWRFNTTATPITFTQPIPMAKPIEAVRPTAQAQKSDKSKSLTVSTIKLPTSESPRVGGSLKQRTITAHLRATASMREAPNAAFVPPPPPIMYGMPSHFAPAPTNFDFMQMPEARPNVVKIPAASKSQTVHMMAPLERLKIDMPQSKAPASVIRETALEKQAPAANSSAAPPADSQKYEPSTLPLERIPGYSENPGGAAPLPGSTP